MTLDKKKPLHHGLRGFKNPHQKFLRKDLLRSVKSHLFSEGQQPFTEKKWAFENLEKPVETQKPIVTWINHSSYLIELEGSRFLLDPIWSKRCSPWRFLGPKRFSLPPFPLSQLPPIDYLILSHNHYDHADLDTLKWVHQHNPALTWIVPLGLKKWLSKKLPSIERGWIIELDWWEQFQSKMFTFTALPAQHFSGRGLFDRNVTLWMGCAVESMLSQKRFYFAGDTGYNPHDFKKIGERFQGMDLSLIPTGAYLPRILMRSIHTNPYEAVKIHQEVGSKLSIGSHFGTFRLSFESLDRLAFDLRQALLQQGLSWQDFRLLQNGQSLNW
jgi:N-acyl-phosphatidylethanolamine-hydrolysing phospholipase D